MLCIFATQILKVLTTSSFRLNGTQGPGNPVYTSVARAVPERKRSWFYFKRQSSKDENRISESFNQCIREGWHECLTYDNTVVSGN